MRSVFGSFLAAALLASAVPCAAQAPGGGAEGPRPGLRGRSAYDWEEAAPARPAAPRRWERIPLQYLDVRTLSAILGTPVLPTEPELYLGAVGYGGFSYGAVGLGAPAYGGPAYGNSGYGGPNYGGAVYGGGVGDGLGQAPRVGAGGTFTPGAGGAGGASGVPGRGPLFPELVIIGDPNSNSLIVDP